MCALGFHFKKNETCVSAGSAPNSLTCESRGVTDRYKSTARHPQPWCPSDWGRASIALQPGTHQGHQATHDLQKMRLGRECERQIAVVRWSLPPGSALLSFPPPSAAHGGSQTWSGNLGFKSRGLSSFFYNIIMCL